MQVQSNPTDAELDKLRSAQFGVTDVLRRAQGNALEAFGLGPSECAYRVVASDSYWRLRDYGNGDNSMSLLVVAAPIKRPYIWDLSPSASAIRYCLEQGLHVYLLEWTPASRGSANNGLDEYARAIADCIVKVSDERPAKKPFLIGHSLGGTLAAIFAALAAEGLSGLVLLSAPLCFEPHTTSFRDALVSLVPPNLSEAEPFPGSLLSQMSALASPATFIWSRLTDAILSVSDQRALEIHARVERWALDEVSLPGKLVHQIIEWLYREDRFCRGVLEVRKALVGPLSLSVPTLAVVNMVDDVAPLASIKLFMDAMPIKNARIIEYPGEGLFAASRHTGWPRSTRAGLAANHFLAEITELNIALADSRSMPSPASTGSSSSHAGGSAASTPRAKDHRRRPQVRSHGNPPCQGVGIFLSPAGAEYPCDPRITDS